MLIEVMQAKIHRAKVTQSNLDYNGSIGIDEDLLEASGILPNQKVDVLNINNGERFTTYAIKEPRGSGVICINGAGARKAQVNDLIIIVAYGAMPYESAKSHTPKVVQVDSKNAIIK